MREISYSYFHNEDVFQVYGLNKHQLSNTISNIYEVLDAIDEKLTSADTEKFSKLVELANLSAMIGNLFRSGLIKNSAGLFKENAPHTFPDLLCTKDEFFDLEIKVALETNKPKGHLVKPGHHMVVRYVLASSTGQFTRGKDKRGDTAWIWEIAIGELYEEHFSVSNTEGDSGKTAVINKQGMDNLKTIFFDPRMFPYGDTGTVKKAYSKYF